MSTQVEINGTTFLSIKEAAKLVSYSRDYVARLAREQKIVASQIGRQWFVDMVSLKNFAEVSELELSVRKQQLSVERKREQSIKQEVRAIQHEVQKKAKASQVHAKLIAMLVLGFGLMSGAGIYTSASLFSTQIANLAGLGGEQALVSESASSVEELAFRVAEPQATTLLTTTIQQPHFVTESEVRAMSEEEVSGIFLLSSAEEIKTENDVAELFSDEVNVDFTDNQNGKVTYRSQAGVETSYPFVLVPNTSESETKSGAQ